MNTRNLLDIAFISFIKNYQMREGKGIISTEFMKRIFVNFQESSLKSHFADIPEDENWYPDLVKKYISRKEEKG